MQRKVSYVIVAVVAALALIGGAFGITNALQDAAAHRSHYRHYQPTPTPHKNEGFATDNKITQAVFKELNQSRAAAGLPLLKWNSTLANGAHQHNLRMAAANKITNQLPGEPSIQQRFAKEGFKSWWNEEAFGAITVMTTDGALFLMNEVIKAKNSHSEFDIGNIVGIDVIRDNKHQRLWLTADSVNTNPPPKVLPTPPAATSSPTVSPTPTPGATPTPAVTPTSKTLPTPDVSPTPKATPVATPMPKATPAPRPTASPTPKPTPTPGITPTPTAPPLPTPTFQVPSQPGTQTTPEAVPTPGASPTPGDFSTRQAVS